MTRPCFKGLNHFRAVRFNIVTSQHLNAEISTEALKHYNFQVLEPVCLRSHSVTEEPADGPSSDKHM